MQKLLQFTLSTADHTGKSNKLQLKQWAFFYYYYYSSQSTDNSSNSVRNPLYCTSEITITIATNWHFCWQSQEKQAASDGMCHGERTRLPACQNPLTRAGLKHVPVAEGFFANQTTQTIPSPLHLRCTGASPPARVATRRGSGILRILERLIKCVLKSHSWSLLVQVVFVWFSSLPFKEEQVVNAGRKQAWDSRAGRLENRTNVLENLEISPHF